MVVNLYVCKWGLPSNVWIGRKCIQYFFFIFKAQKCILISCADKMFFVIFISFHIFIKCPIIKNKDIIMVGKKVAVKKIFCHISFVFFFTYLHSFCRYRQCKAQRQRGRAFCSCFYRLHISPSGGDSCKHPHKATLRQKNEQCSNKATLFPFWYNKQTLTQTLHVWNTKKNLSLNVAFKCKSRKHEMSLGGLQLIFKAQLSSYG